MKYKSIDESIDLHNPNISEFISPKILDSIEKLRFELAEEQKNPRICDILNRTVLKGGKRLRPTLAFLISDLFNVSHESVAPYSRAIEMIHASSLAHDDVIDNAASRRGEPSINIVTSNKKAILAGDYLISHVLYEICKQEHIPIFKEISLIFAQLAEGEWLQIENFDKPNLRREDIIEVALKKTGSVMGLCCTIPALLADINDDIVDKARRLGHLIGIAFQHTDDILDFQRKDSTVMQDLKNDVINSVIFEALAIKENNSEIDAKKIKELTLDPDTIEPAMQAVKKSIKSYLAEAASLLESIYTQVSDHTKKKQKKEASDTSSSKEGFNQLNKLLKYLESRTF